MIVKRLLKEFQTIVERLLHDC